MRSAKYFIKRNKKILLTYKMRTLTPFVDDEEQKELEEVLKNLTSEHFETGEIIKL